MEFRLSANAQEFMPAHLPAKAAQFSLRLASPDGRPLQQHQQVYQPVNHAFLPVNREQWITELSIAAPEFRPSSSLQLKNPVGFEPYSSQRRHYDISPDQDLMSHDSRRSNQKHSAPKPRRETRIHGSKRKTDPPGPEFKANDTQTEIHSSGHRIETQRRYDVVSKKQGRCTEVEVSQATRGDKKNKLSMQRPFSQHDTRKQAEKHAELEWRQSSRTPSETRDSSERQNRNLKYENEAYPQLAGSQAVSDPRLSDQSMLQRRSWSKVLQSKPCSSGLSSNRRQLEEKQEKGGRNSGATIQKRHNPEENSNQRLQRDGKNQVYSGSHNQRIYSKQQAAADGFKPGHSSSTCHSNQIPLNKKKQKSQPYHFDSKWLADTQNNQRQKGVSAGRGVRTFTDMRATRDKNNWRKKSTMITEHYKFENVTKQFSERVKSVLFKVRDEANAVKESFAYNLGKSRGWYDLSEWNNSAQNKDAVKESCYSVSGRVKHTFSSRFGSLRDNCYYRLESSEQLGNTNNGSLSWRQGANRNWPPFESGLSQTVSERPQKRPDVVLHRSTAMQSAGDELGRRTEESREYSLSVCDDERELGDSHLEGSDHTDSEDEWVCVETKSKIRSKRKQLASANRQQFGAGKQKGVDGPRARHLSGDRALKGSEDRPKGRPLSWSDRAVKGSEAADEAKLNKSQIGGKSKMGDKSKQSCQSTEKKAKAKRKKKKAKKKEKPLYDNDQQKIIEFKMREMIEEHLKMNLVELTKTRDSTENVSEKERLEEWPEIGNMTARPATVMSFSEALKRKMPSSEQPFSARASEPSGVNIIDMSKLSEEERMELRRKMWKDKRKQKKKEKKQRKRAEKGDGMEETAQKKPVTFDLGSVFDRILQSSTEEKKSSKKPAKTVLFSSGVISVASGVAKKNRPDGSRSKPNKGKPSGNFLDSTQPLKMSGKERESPRKPKVTLLKKIILRAREAKRKAREAQTGQNATESQSKDPVKETETVKAHDFETDGHANEAEVAVGAEGAASNVEEMENCSNIQNDRGAPDDHPCEPLTDLPKEVIAQLHTRKFREYCDHLLSTDINSVVYNILKSLHRFQARAYVENPIKAKAKRRLALGIREVAKHAKLGKLQCVIIAPNLEKVNIEGGIDFYLSKIIFNCKQFNIPLVYAMNRQVLGFVLSRKVPISAIGIFSYAGVEDDFKKLCVLVEEQREKYKERVAQIKLQQSQLQRNTGQSHTEYDGTNKREFGSSEFRINPNAPQFIPRSMTGSFTR